jgi:peptidoglycan-N-acetylglucosamine deacetylase
MSRNNRSRMIGLLAVILVLVFSCVTGASAGNTGLVFVGVNDELLSYPQAEPETKNGTTYMPLRYFAEKTGAELSWNAADNIVDVHKGQANISLEINQGQLRNADGSEAPFDLYLKNDRTMVPFRYISEMFGYKVSFNAAGPVARASDSTAKLTDEQFYAKYRTVIEQKKEEMEPEPKRVAYLTFDDGPNGYTSGILDVLKDNGVKATFFVLAGGVQAHPEAVNRMLDEGHNIGLHGVTHDASKIYRSPQTVVNEMEQDNDAVTAATGYRTSIMRVPYGSKPWMSQGYRDAVVEAGYRMWDWNIDSCDSCSANVTADQIVANVKKQAAGKDYAVILFHDKKATLAALPRVISYLKEQEFGFKVIRPQTKPLNFWGDVR